MERDGCQRKSRTWSPNDDPACTPMSALGTVGRVKHLQDAHSRYRASCLNLVASENVISPAVAAALQGDLEGRYADFNGLDLSARKYRGGGYVVELERLCETLVCETFSAPACELRAISGHVAGSAVIMAVCKPGDLVLEVGQEGGGHRLAAKFAQASLIDLRLEWLPFDPTVFNIDSAAAAHQIVELQPRLVILGSSTFLHPHPVVGVAEACRTVGAVLTYDASHVMGLLAAGRFQDPLREGAQLVFGSTHKTLLGPQGGIVFGERDLVSDVAGALYPPLVTNHHPFRIPALAIALAEHVEFGRAYAGDVIENARSFGRTLDEAGIAVVGGETDSHTVLIATPGVPGAAAADDLERQRIIVNPSRLPAEFGGEGIRFGLQELTRRGGTGCDGCDGRGACGPGSGRRQRLRPTGVADEGVADNPLHLVRAMILAVDCGLSAVKVTSATREGRTVQVEREPYPTDHTGIHAEQNPEDWWRALRNALGRIRERQRVEIVVPTGHMHALVLVDAAGKPLMPCLTLHDRRGEDQLYALDARAFHRATGQSLDASLPVAKLLWLARMQPALLARTAAVLAPKDYLGMRLSGTIVTDPLDAGGTGLYNTTLRQWSREILDMVGLSESVLPTVESCTTPRGRLRRDIARELDLPEASIVAVGAGDDIELLGATGYRTDAAVEHVGSSGAILRVPAELGRVSELEVQLTAIPGRLAVGAAIANCTTVINWIKTALGVTLADALAISPRPDDPVALPQLLPERRPDRVADFGARVAGLRIHHDRFDVARAFVVGVAGTLRELLRRVESDSGKLDVLVASGGSRCEPWATLRASAYERPISILDVDPTARGCVALGMVALGDFTGVEEAIRIAPATSEQVVSDSRLTRVLRTLFDRAAEYGGEPITYRLTG